MIGNEARRETRTYGRCNRLLHRRVDGSPLRRHDEHDERAVAVFALDVDDHRVGDFRQALDRSIDFGGSPDKFADLADHSLSPLVPRLDGGAEVATLKPPRCVG